jgi:hypothetical protein
VIFAARTRQFRTRTEVFRSFAAPGLALSTSLLVPAGPPSPDVAALLRRLPDDRSGHREQGALRSPLPRRS